MNSESELIDRIESGELAIKSIGSEGRILGFVFEYPGCLSMEARNYIRHELDEFISRMGLSVPAIVAMEGAVIKAVVEVEKT